MNSKFMLKAYPRWWSRLWYHHLQLSYFLLLHQYAIELGRNQGQLLDDADMRYQQMPAQQTCLITLHRRLPIRRQPEVPVLNRTYSKSKQDLAVKIVRKICGDSAPNYRLLLVTKNQGRNSPNRKPEWARPPNPPTDRREDWPEHEFWEWIGQIIILKYVKIKTRDSFSNLNPVSNEGSPSWPRCTE